MKESKIGTQLGTANSLNKSAESVVKKDSSDKPREPKTTDKIKVFLACVPSLENAKTDLTDIIDQVDEATKKEVEGFIKQIEGIQVKVLEFTQMTITQTIMAKEPSPAPTQTQPGVQEHNLAELLAGKVAESEIEKIVLADVKFSNGKLVVGSRAAGSVVVQIPDATR